METARLIGEAIDSVAYADALCFAAWMMWTCAIAYVMHVVRAESAACNARCAEWTRQARESMGREGGER